MRWLDEMDLEPLHGKSVFCRVDFNVPLDDSGNILDASRIELALPTIRRLLRAQAKVVLVSHLGRPKKKPRAALSLEPVGNYLRDLLDHEIIFIHDCVGDGVAKIVAQSAPGSLILLENVRFHPGEENNDPVFSKLLAKNMDFYVNDAFGAVHRAHASVDAVAHLFKEPIGGLLLKKEVETLSALLNKPKKPFIAIIGGAKVSTKISALVQLLRRVDALLIGGAMAYTFLKARGHNVGKSLVQEEYLGAAQNLLRKAAELSVKIYLPCDHVVADSKDSESRVIEDSAFDKKEAAFDIGPKTIANFTQVIGEAKTIFWNGPLGMNEVPAFARGTNEIMKAVVLSDASTIVGGGDTIAALNKAGLANKVNFVSSGGGASLELLEGKKLPGLVALGYYG